MSFTCSSLRAGPRRRSISRSARQPAAGWRGRYHRGVDPGRQAMSVGRSWLGIALIAVCIGADAQSIHKCVGKDGKTSYSNEPCPGSNEIQAAPPPAVKGADAKKGSSASPASAGPSFLPGKKTRKMENHLSG